MSDFEVLEEDIEEEEETLRVDYDDGALDVVEKVNAALAAYGLEFVDDGEDHDGFCLFILRSQP
jgi:hypothetical protein